MHRAAFLLRLQWWWHLNSRAAFRHFQVFKRLIFLRCALQSYNVSLSSIVLIDSRAAIISPSADWSIRMRLTASCFGKRRIVSVIFQARTVASSFLNVRICCSSLSSMTVNEGSLVFGLLVGQKKQLEVVTFGARQLSINRQMNWWWNLRHRVGEMRLLSQCFIQPSHRVRCCITIQFISLWNQLHYQVEKR